MANFEEINRQDDADVQDNSAHPDPTNLPAIPGPVLLVRQVSIKEKSKGGIILPSVTQKHFEYVMNVGKVLKVGDLAYTNPKFQDNVWAKVGDYVVWRRESPIMRFKMGKVNLTLLKDDSVLMLVDDPAILSELAEDAQEEVFSSDFNSQ